MCTTQGASSPPSWVFVGWVFMSCSINASPVPSPLFTERFKQSHPAIIDRVIEKGILKNTRVHLHKLIPVGLQTYARGVRSTPRHPNRLPHWSNCRIDKVFSLLVFCGNPRRGPPITRRDHLSRRHQVSPRGNTGRSNHTSCDP